MNARGLFGRSRGHDERQHQDVSLTPLVQLARCEIAMARFRVVANEPLPLRTRVVRSSMDRFLQAFALGRALVDD
jgi:hypothetical protein